MNSASFGNIWVNLGGMPWEAFLRRLAKSNHVNDDSDMAESNPVQNIFIN